MAEWDGEHDDTGTGDQSTHTRSPDTGDGRPGPEHDAQDAEAQGTGEGDQRLANARKEAARYRVEAKDARTERDAASGTLDATRRQLAMTYGGRWFYQPEDLFLGDVPVSEVLDDGGNVSKEKVQELARRQAQARPGLSPMNRQHGAGGHGNGLDGKPSPNVTSWSGAAKASRDSSNRIQSNYDD